MAIGVADYARMCSGSGAFQRSFLFRAAGVVLLVRRLHKAGVGRKIANLNIV